MKNAEEILSVLLGFDKALQLAKQDGKFDVTDLAFVAEPLLELPGAVVDAKLALDELKVATPEERGALYQRLSEKYDIPDDVREAKVEAGVELLMALGKFAGTVSA